MFSKTILAVLLLAVSLLAQGARPATIVDDLTPEEERILHSCTKRCDHDNPCSHPGAAQYHEHCLKRWFIQCGPAGKCYEQACPRKTRWSQEFQTCVHKECGECHNRCTMEQIEDGMFYRVHCKDNSKFMQCDEFGGCFVRQCPDGLIFRNAKQACVWPEAD